ncbi:MAG: DUF4203 domain-containing protein [Eubacteriales bacterium]|nr:DUF4203 domain-containing protein [Eubacteriales bacterium]
MTLFMGSFITSLSGMTSRVPDLSKISSQLSKVLHVTFGSLPTKNVPTDFITSTLLPNIDKITESYSLVLAVITLVIGIIGCLFGYKLSRLFMTISGFIAGIFLGFLVGINFFDKSNGTIILSCLIGGIIIAIFSYTIYRAGIFFLCFLLGFVAAANYVQLTGNIAFFVAVLCGLILGVLALRFVRPIIIVATAFVCGTSTAEAILSLGKHFNVEFFSRSYAPLATFAGVFVIACLFQFLTTKNDEPGKKKKKRKKKKYDD